VSNGISNAPIDPVPSRPDPEDPGSGGFLGVPASARVGAGQTPEPHRNPPEDRFAGEAGGSEASPAAALVAYAAGLGIVPGYTWDGRLPPYPPRVLRLCLDLAEDQRHRRLDVLLGRLLPLLLHRVHRLGLTLRREYRFVCPCESRP
jgi:hypothetical protein